ncbi:MAG: hypothetical protein ACKODE_11370 [Acidimicrobiaceae bacterium]
MATSPAGINTREVAISAVLELRVAMNKVLEQIANGDRLLSAVMQTSDELPLNQLYVVKALESFSQIGKIRARQVLDELKISHKQKVGELSQKQCQLIIEALK